MKRVNLIITHNDYLLYINHIAELEVSREFCRHDLVHYMDVARIAYIINLENNLMYPKEVIYAAALLHDIGRWRQYESKVPHEQASAELALEILKDCNFNQKEIDMIVGAIRNHRSESPIPNSLEEVINRSDKISRTCFRCDAESKCYWPSNKKNMTILY